MGKVSKKKPKKPIFLLSSVGVHQTKKSLPSPQHDSFTSIRCQDCCGVLHHSGFQNDVKSIIRAYSKKKEKEKANVYPLFSHLEKKGGGNR